MSNATPRSVGKTMSSRLMTMKFMQRAAASTSPTTPQPQSRGTETPASKRQKASHIPITTATPKSDQELIQAALSQEEERREKAVEKMAAEAGETKWVLSTVNGGAGDGVQGLRVEKAGFADLDQNTWTPATVGRRSFGKFNREIEKHQKGTADDPSSSSGQSSRTSDEDGEDGDSPAGTGDSIRASKEEMVKRTKVERLQRKQHRKAEKAELSRLAEKRRKKEVKLNNLASISGGGGGTGSRPGFGSSDKTCYECGETGHEKRHCPRRGKRELEDGPNSHPKRPRPSSDG